VTCFPLLALGLLAGLSRVYLGVNFPFDVLAALPLAAIGALATRALRAPALPMLSRGLHLYDRAMLAARSRLRRQR
jgi:undecaprenyl-diphosphatase